MENTLQTMNQSYRIHIFVKIILPWLNTYFVKYSTIESVSKEKCEWSKIEIPPLQLRIDFQNHEDKKGCKGYLYFSTDKNELAPSFVHV